MSEPVFKTITEYLNYMVKEGYMSERDFAPLKCYKCKSKNLEDYDEYYEDHWGIIEYAVRCKDCGQTVGRWSYGHWEL